MTITSGSSSIKFSLYRMGSAEHRVASGNAAGIGHDFSRIRIEYGKGAAPYERTIDLQDHRTALEEIIGWFQHWEECGDVNAIGHRLVYGGSTYIRPNLIDARLLTAVDTLIPFAPDHLPHEISAIWVCERFYPGVKQVDLRA